MILRDECEEKLLDASLLQWVKRSVDRGVFTTDAKLRICTWNKWLERYSGHNAEDVIGRSLLEIYPELKIRRLEQHYRDALVGHSRTLSHVLHGYLLPLRPLAADLGFESMRQSAQVMPLMIDDRIVGTITLIEDVTERAATERELRLRVAELERLSAREQ